MTNDNTTRILTRLELGFRDHSARLKQLEKDLAVSLEHARTFGRQHGLAEDWKSDWHREWDRIDGILSRTNALVNEMDARVAGDEEERYSKALEAWNAIQVEDAALVEAVGVIRAQALVLSSASRQEWNRLAITLESHMETVHACAEALRIRLELLKKHSREEVEHLVRDVFSTLPDGPDVPPSGRECRKAAAELVRERHSFTGFMDVVKGLLLWVETTDERVHKNRSLTVDET